MTKWVPDLRIALFVAVHLAGCVPTAPIGQPTQSRKLVSSQTTITCESLLENMPLNNGARCSGVCLAIKALLDGECAGDGSDDPADLGAKIFANACTRGKLRYRPRLLIDGGEQSLDARESLNRLGMVVTEQYRERFTELAKSEEGRERLWTAATSFVADEKELDQILKQSIQQIEVFCGLGGREFADGSLKDSNHAFLIRLMPDGTRAVYDPNDPGHSIPCRLSSEENRLIVEWTCRYRDTHVSTTQSYFIVPRQAYFGQLAGDPSANLGM